MTALISPLIAILIASLILGGFTYLAFVFIRWAHRDGELRGKPGWLVVLCVLTWPGLLAWLVLRPPISPDRPVIRRNDQRVFRRKARIVEFAEEHGSLLP